MKVEDPSALLVQWFYHKHKVLPERRRVLMAKLYQICCPKCNNKTDFYRYGKDAPGRQKYQCKKCWYQWAENHPYESPGRPRKKEYPSCPVCGKAMYVHHNREHYIHYSCTDRKCRHSVLYQSLQLFQFRPCPSSLERQILSGCAIRSM